MTLHAFRTIGVSCTRIAKICGRTTRPSAATAISLRQDKGRLKRDANRI